MPYIIVIDKTGTVKETNIKEYVVNDLYKKANFKTADGFQHRNKWELEINNTKYNISVYGKINGKAGQENKYDFPPPIDNTLFFGGCVLVNENMKELNKINDLRISDWNKIYENLMGGFEDLGEEDDEEEDDKEPNEYVCDDFVVEDDDVDYEDLDLQDDDEDEDDEEIVIKKGKKVNKKKKEKKPSKKNAELIVQETNQYLDCQSELEEEEYFA